MQFMPGPSHAPALLPWHREQVASTTITAEARRAHDDAVAAGEPGYLDPATGLFVMTAAYLAARDWCCGNGCRHCPYQEEA